MINSKNAKIVMEYQPTKEQEAVLEGLGNLLDASNEIEGALIILHLKDNGKAASFLIGPGLELATAIVTTIQNHEEFKLLFQLVDKITELADKQGWTGDSNSSVSNYDGKKFDASSLVAKGDLLKNKIAADPELSKKMHDLKVNEKDQPKQKITLTMSRDQVAFVNSVIYEIVEKSRGLMPENMKKNLVALGEELNEVMHKNDWCIDPGCTYYKGKA